MSNWMLTDEEVKSLVGPGFDEWLEEHDQQIRVRYEMMRRPEPIHIDNIEGEPASFVASQVAAQAVSQVADEMPIDLWATFGGVRRSALEDIQAWVRERARRIREAKR